MQTLLILIIVCSLLLTASACLEPLAGFVLMAAALVWLLFLIRNAWLDKRKRLDLRSQLQARWSLPVLLLTGLPLPPEHAALLFAVDGGLRVHTPLKDWQLERDQLERLLLSPADWLLKRPDQAVSRALGISSPSFAPLRETIRRLDRPMRQGSLLFLVYATGETTGLWVLTSALRPQALKRLLTAAGLAAKTTSLQPKGRSAPKAPPQEAGGDRA